MIESFVKSFKEGRKYGFHPSLRKLSGKSPFSLLSYIGAYFESWVKFLGSSFFHLANFEKIVESKIGFTHIRTYCLQFRIGVDKSTLTHLF
jgi:hypothetical protein